jgi:hypothetical protein
MEETTEYDPCDIYNADEKHPFLNLQPSIYGETITTAGLWCSLYVVLVVAISYHHLLLANIQVHAAIRC